MATLREISQRISGVKSTSKITSAMKMVAAAKMKRAQNSIESARPYVEKLEDMLSNLVAAVGEEYSHPLLQQKNEINKITILAIGSDRGLCGSFNTTLFRKVVDDIDILHSEDYPNAEFEIIPIGKKAVDFFKKQSFEVPFKVSDCFAHLDFSTVKEVLNFVVPRYDNNQVDKVMVYYNTFINVIKQNPTMKNIIPIEANIDKSATSGFNVDYIYEPGQEAILDELLPKLVDIQLWSALLDSNAAEQASRMLAMDNATINARDLIQHLELVYNKARQASITTEMLEIVSGAEALKTN